MYKFSFLLPIIGIILALSFDKPHISSPKTIDWYANGNTQTIRGTIISEPDRRPMQTKYTIETQSGRVLVTDYSPFNRFEYGSTVEATGKLERPEPIEDFAYDKYLSMFDVYAVMYRADIKQNPLPRNTNPLLLIKRSLYKLKSRFENKINRLLPEPHASFMAGLLTGSRRGIPEDLMEKFNTTGLTHIIAISGYNITIIITLISGSLFFLTPSQRFAPAILAIILFTIFAGASAAVVRASIMGILGLIALQLGRKTNVRLSILWTAFFMIAWNPKIFWYDAGFQLSFAAVIGLAELSPYISPLLKHIPEKLAIRESLLATLAANIATLPLIAYLFGRISLISPVANILIAPAIPLAMLVGTIATVVSFLSEPLGRLLIYPAWALLEYIIAIANICSKLPFASYQM